MITLQDLIDRYGEQELTRLTDRVNKHDAKVIDMAVVNGAIADAEGEVESYLNAVGLVGRDPDNTLLYAKGQHIPKALITKTCDITRFYLYEDGVVEIVQKRYDNALKWLKDVKADPKMLTGTEQSDKHGTNKSTVHVIPNPVPSSWIE